MSPLKNWNNYMRIHTFVLRRFICSKISNSQVMLFVMFDYKHKLLTVTKLNVFLTDKISVISGDNNVADNHIFSCNLPSQYTCL